MMSPHSDHHQRRYRPDSHSLSRHRRSRPGAAGRVGVHVDPRSTVRLDPDPRTDPPIPLTAQVNPTHTGPGRLQTHPHAWGVSPGGECAQ